MAIVDDGNGEKLVPLEVVRPKATEPKRPKGRNAAPEVGTDAPFSVQVDGDTVVAAELISEPPNG